MSASWEIREGDCLERLAEMPDESVQCCVTSPPYFGLRDYGTGSWEGGDEACDHRAGSDYGSKSDTEHKGQIRGGPYRAACGKCGASRVDRQIGLEATPDEFVARLVGAFREVRRVLRSDGTLWLNIGDSYCAAASGPSNPDRGPGWHGVFKAGTLERRDVSRQGSDRRVLPNAKQKDLLGIPWLLAFALRADGWYLRSDIIWAKPNPMPESVTDRPTSAHEHLFLLAKSARYFYDADAIREPMAEGSVERYAYAFGGAKAETLAAADKDGMGVRTRTIGERQPTDGRNKRNVWEIATQPYGEAHFATFPPKLIEPCILAGSAEGDTILDPFAGAGTTGLVALRRGRGFLGVELNPAYAEMARERIRNDAPLLNTPAEVAA